MDNIFGFNPRVIDIEIPRMFYDSLTEKPFTNCNICNCDLIHTAWSYVIEKVLRKNIISGKMEVVFEYALCFNCVRKLVESYSKESMERIQEYFKNAASNSEDEDIPLILSNEQDLKNHLSKCTFTGKPIDEMDEYQMAAQFSGDRLALMMPPYVFGGNAMDDVTELLSEKTLGEIDDFTGRYLTGPPEFRDFFKTPNRRPILI